MINRDIHLASGALGPDAKQEPSRNGFGRGLLQAGKDDPRVVALCADLTESTRMEPFAKEFPERFVQIGVAEQNLVTVASGMSAVGKIPFTSSYAAFSPGRNWEQIRTTICLNERNVKIVGSHAGVSVGPDGATHQMLEDIALMRVLPHMRVVVPCDSVEAEKATLALAKDDSPAYLRLGRADTGIITTPETPFSLEENPVFVIGHDVTLIACGAMVYHALQAVKLLEAAGVKAEVINAVNIKPFDEKSLLKSARKTRIVVSVEEAQAAGGLGGVVAETLSRYMPTPHLRLGIDDRFGQSGEPAELYEEYGISPGLIAKRTNEFILDTFKQTKRRA